MTRKELALTLLGLVVLQFSIWLAFWAGYNAWRP